MDVAENKQKKVSLFSVNDAVNDDDNCRSIDRSICMEYAAVVDF